MGEKEKLKTSIHVSSESGQTILDLVLSWWTGSLSKPDKDVKQISVEEFHRLAREEIARNKEQV